MSTLVSPRRRRSNEIDWEAIAAGGYTGLVYGAPVLLAPPLARVLNRGRSGQRLRWWQLALGGYLAGAMGLLSCLIATGRRTTATDPDHKPLVLP